MDERPALPHAYRGIDPRERGSLCPVPPRNIFIEVTNRCNLRCATCPRTFGICESPRDLTLEEFRAITDQFPEMERAVLHGIGEPLLNTDLPEMIRLLRARGVKVIFNSNGTLLDANRQSALAESGLDEYRLSLDSANSETYSRIRGSALFDVVIRNLREFVTVCRSVGAGAPRISIWCMAMRENIDQLPELVRLAADLGVSEIYLQRLTYEMEAEEQHGLARPEQALYRHLQAREVEIVARCDDLSRELGISFQASGATDPVHSLAGAGSDDATPWSACLRPWTTAYITANGNALPCCIAPFSTVQQKELILGNVWEKAFGEIWNDLPYRRWRQAVLSSTPHRACSGCGVYWSL